MTPRLVATDLDGTLVHSDGSVTARTAEVLRTLEERGVPVVFVTGRPLRWTEEVFEHVGGLGLAIVSNGAMVWDVHAREVRRTHALEVAAGLEVAALIREAVPGAVFSVEDIDGFSLEDDFMPRHAALVDARRGPLAEIYARPALKLLARHEDLPAQEFWDRAREVVGDRAVITWSSSDALLEISAAGVTKASALAALCAELGVGAEDVVAFGDMPNDLPMLTWVGTSYAMANAHPTVLAAADRVAPRNDDDGVAVVLSDLFDLSPAP